MENPNLYSKELTAYGQWILRTAEELVDDKRLVTDYGALLKRDAYEIVNFEIDLATLIKNFDEYGITEYNSIDVSRLQLVSDFFGTRNKVRKICVPGYFKGRGGYPQDRWLVMVEFFFELCSFGKV